jgi:hypothetical protein
MASIVAYRLRRIAATVMGAGLVGLSGWFTWQHTSDMTAPIAAIVGAAMLHFCEAAWAERQRLRAIAFAALAALASLICLTAVLDRVATTYDTKLQGRQSENLSRVEAEKALTTAEATAQAAEAAALAECTSGRGPRCKGLEERADGARQRVAEARAELVRLGSAIVVDPAARRLAAILPVSEATIGLAQPLMLPVWLELSGLVLLTYGLAPGAPKAPSKPAGAKARRKRRTPRKPAPKAPAKATAGKPSLKLVAANDQH